MVVRGRRATVVGGGLSALFHLALLAVLTTGPRSASLGEPGPSTVSIELRGTTEVEPAPTPAPAATIAPVERRSHQGLRPVSRRLPRTPVAVLHDAQVVADPDAESGDAEEQGGEAGEDAVTSAPPPAPAPVAAATPTPAIRTPVIAAETARALRVYDTFPMLLAQNSLTRAEVLVEVCVSDHGQVDDAVIAEGGMRAIDNTLRTAIRSWRYRPLLVNGSPTPFCHFMKIKYALN